MRKTSIVFKRNNDSERSPKFRRGDFANETGSFEKLEEKVLKKRSPPPEYRREAIPKTAL